MAQPKIIELSGRIDNVTSSAVEATLDTALDAMPSALILDLAGVTFVSSIGLRVLLMAAKRCRKQDAGLALYSVAPQIASVFRLSGLNTFFPIYDSREAALAAFPPA
jgi:anti-anti-sigma factor